MSTAAVGAWELAEWQGKHVLVQSIATAVLPRVRRWNEVAAGAPDERAAAGVRRHKNSSKVRSKAPIRAERSSHAL